MIWKRLVAVAIGPLALALVTTGNAGADLIVNGGFEQYTPGSGGPVPYGDLQYSPVTGWTQNSTSPGSLVPLNLLEPPGANSTTGSWDSGNSAIRYLWGPPGVNNGFAPTSPVGGNFIALEGDPQFGSPIWQTVNGLTPGQTYQLSFYWATAQLYPAGGDTTEQLQISFGSQTQSTPILNTLSAGFNPWRQETMTFVADASSSVLTFLAVGTPSGGPPFVLLDGVSLNAVPEPSSLLLGGLGLVGLGLYRRVRRGRAGVAA